MGVGKSVYNHDELVVWPNRRVFIADENGGRQTTFPLRSAVNRSKG